MQQLQGQCQFDGQWLRCAIAEVRSVDVDRKVAAVRLVLAWAWPYEGGWDLEGAAVVALAEDTEEDMGVRSTRVVDRDRDGDRKFCPHLGDMLHSWEGENGG